MTQSNNSIHTALGVAQDKKVRVRALGRGARSKSKLHFPPQADRNWKPINAFATRLGRKMGTAPSICTRVGSKHRDLFLGNWKEQELVWEAEQYVLILLEFPLPSFVALILLS